MENPTQATAAQNVQQLRTEVQASAAPANEGAPQATELSVQENNSVSYAGMEYQVEALARTRSTMGQATGTQSKTFFKQRNISGKLFFPIRSPYIPRLGATPVRFAQPTIAFNRRNLVRETSRIEEEVVLPEIVLTPAEEIAKAETAAKEAAMADTNKLQDDMSEVTYQFQDQELIIDDRHLQAMNQAGGPQSRIVIKHLRNEVDAPKEAEPEERPGRTLLSSDYKGNMELVDPNELLIYFEETQVDDNGEKTKVGTPFVVPFESRPTPVNTGSDASYKTIE